MDGKLTTEILAKVLPDWLIESLADDLDVVERNRKVDIVLLVWSLILGFPAGARRTLLRSTQFDAHVADSMHAA